MPVPELMTWIPAQRRWTKMYRGRRYYISARQLGIVPETKEASVDAANQWWRDKQAEIHAERRMHAKRKPQLSMREIEQLNAIVNENGIAALLRFAAYKVAHEAKDQSFASDTRIALDKIALAVDAAESRFEDEGE